MVSNQNLCKYLYYNSASPLTESDLSDTTSLLYTKIFPYNTAIDTFKDDNGNPVASSVINVLFDNFELGNVNTKFINGQLIFIVLCHTSLLRLNTSQLRHFCLLNEIAEMFTEQRVIGIGKGELERCKIVWADSMYTGIKLTYKDYEFA